MGSPRGMAGRGRLGPLGDDRRRPRRGACRARLHRARGAVPGVVPAFGRGGVGGAAARVRGDRRFRGRRGEDARDAHQRGRQPGAALAGGAVRRRGRDGRDAGPARAGPSDRLPPAAVAGGAGGARRARSRRSRRRRGAGRLDLRSRRRRVRSRPHSWRRAPTGAAATSSRGTASRCSPGRPRWARPRPRACSGSCACARAGRCTSARIPSSSGACSGATAGRCSSPTTRSGRPSTGADAAERWARDLDRILTHMDADHVLVWTSRPAPLHAGLRRVHRENGLQRFPRPGEVMVDATDLTDEEKALMLYRHAVAADLRRRCPLGDPCAGREHRRPCPSDSRTHTATRVGAAGELRRRLPRRGHRCRRDRARDRPPHRGDGRLARCS